MKTFIAAILCSIVATPTLAQGTVNLPVECVTYQDLHNMLEKYQELPFIRGVSTRSDPSKRTQNVLVLYMNAQDGSWTVVEKNGDTYCVLAAGAGIEPVPVPVIEEILAERKKKQL